MVFDKSIGARKRRRVEVDLGAMRQLIASALGSAAAEEEVGLRLSLFILGRDALLGTLGESLHSVLIDNPRRRLDDIRYPETPPETGVPYVERVVTESFMEGKVRFAAGDRMRIDSGLCLFGIPPASVLEFSAAAAILVSVARCRSIYGRRLSRTWQRSRCMRKLSRTRCKRKTTYLPGTSHSEAVRMTPSEARRQILQALAAASLALNDPYTGPRLRDPNADIGFEELNLDSLAALECCMVLEESSGLEIDPADLTTYNSVNKLAAYIVEKRAV